MEEKRRIELKSKFGREGESWTYVISELAALPFDAISNLTSSCFAARGSCIFSF